MSALQIQRQLKKLDLISVLVHIILQAHHSLFLNLKLACQFFQFYKIVLCNKILGKSHFLFGPRNRNRVGLAFIASVLIKPANDTILTFIFFII